MEILARRFAFRQGLWIEDLQIPPGQECSNGSLILIAVVLWRTFRFGRAQPKPARRGEGAPRTARRAVPTISVSTIAMKLLKVKTTRFAQVVEDCGKPQVYTLWQKPSTDRHLQSQLKNNRAMTILKSPSGTDFGIVGFNERKDARYLIFPKSLKRFADKRIVAVDWALVRE